MRRILVMVLHNFFLVPVYWIKLCYHARHAEKYTDEQHYEMIQTIVHRANKGGHVQVDSYGVENLPKEQGFMLYPNHQGLYDICYLTAIPGMCVMAPRNGKDLEKMLYWYELSAEAGSDAGQLNMGACYDMGLGVPRDASRAVEYYELSAAQGNSLAQLYLAKCYYNGDGVSRDVDLAASYANQAVNNVRDPKASADAASFLNEHGL